MKNIYHMDPEEFDYAMELPKQCSRCKKTFPRGDFPMSSAHGRLVIRSWCKDCLKAYYREKNAAKKLVRSETEGS